MTIPEHVAPHGTCVHYDGLVEVALVARRRAITFPVILTTIEPGAALPAGAALAGAHRHAGRFRLYAFVPFNPER